MDQFKPNLIPNNPKDGSFTKEFRNSIIDRNGGIGKYIISNKKDGCRMQLGLGTQILSRSLKPINSILVNSRFNKLNQLCLDLNITLDGEFYMHGERFPTIMSFFSNTDVTREDYRSKLTKTYKKNPVKFKEDYNNRTIEFLTTFHKDLKFFWFDGTVVDRPDLISFSDRMVEIESRLTKHNLEDLYIDMFDFTTIEDISELDDLYDSAIENDFEGLVLTHIDHEYKFGRNTLKQGTILKLKDDNREYDGIVIDVEEGTMVKDGVSKTKTELGRSRTSKKKEDRVPNGKAKGFVVQFEDKGTFTVCLRGFDDDAKRELLENKQNYIGKHFKYTGMPPVKDFPRSVYFDCWRDEK